MPGQEAAPTRRGRGKRAGLTLEQIVASARFLGGADLTMQAVADHLGVDRKTINHYVGDRSRLLRLAALAELATSAGLYDFPPEATWQELCVLFANVLVDGLIGAREFAEHLTIEPDVVVMLIDPAEQLASKMADAGFDDEFTVRCLAQIANLCLAYARDSTAAGPRDNLTRPELLLGAIEARDGHAGDEHPNLSRIAAAGVDTYDRAQFDLMIATFVAGTERLLERRTRLWVPTTP